MPFDRMVRAVDAWAAAHGRRDVFAQIGTTDWRPSHIEWTALLEPERTPFAIYDRAGTEASTEGLLLPANNVSKSLIFVEGATHTGFLDTCNPLLASSLSCASHREVAIGYLNAFLRWQVRGQTAYREYLTGAAVPTTLRVDEVTTWPLFQAPRKRVVDNFEQGGFGVNTIGGIVQTAPGIVHIAEGEARVLESSCPHDTQVLRVRWSGQSSLMWFHIAAMVAPLLTRIAGACTITPSK